jgi:hypothetical protein
MQGQDLLQVLRKFGCVFRIILGNMRYEIDEVAEGYDASRACRSR